MTEVEKVKQAVKDSVDNVIDATRESLHRSSADAERMRRDVDGDRMTTTEKMTSATNETRERVAAGIDHAKQEVRKRT
jgi:hypothetical protein